MDKPVYAQPVQSQPQVVYQQVPAPAPAPAAGGSDAMMMMMMMQQQQQNAQAAQAERMMMMNAQNNHNNGGGGGGGAVVVVNNQNKGPNCFQWVFCFWITGGLALPCCIASYCTGGSFCPEPCTCTSNKNSTVVIAR